MKDWYAGIYKALISASVISFIISFFSSGNVSFGSILAGYSVLIMAIMMILLILFNNIFKVPQSGTTFQIISSIIMTTGPFLLMLGLIGFIMYLIIFYMNPIMENKVSPSYFTFSNIAIILFLLQIYIVYTNISTEKFETTGKLNKITSSLMYLLGVLTTICSLILFTILKYFRTDGFQCNK
uniref:Uncharacterized protein n=1 Tax=viral metagenome TaxID=1070528 RepID=A0A6C0EUP4_9ZZZZ